MQSKMLKMSCAILAAISLTSCAANTTATVPLTVHDYCLLAKGITFSEQHGDVETVANKFDTPETAAQVKDHDLVYEKTCGGTVDATVTHKA